MKYQINLKQKRLNVIVVPVFATALAIVVNTAALAWGPKRTTYTMDKPAASIAFNSIDKDANWGDERNFVVIKDITDSYDGANNIAELAKAGGFSDRVSLANNHIYMVKAFVHNNAAANLDLTATNTRIKSVINKSNDGSFDVQSTISADNCGADKKGNAGKPCAVWDDAYVVPDSGDKGTYTLSPLLNTAHYFNNQKDFATGGFLLSNDLHAVSSDGALLGYDKMDGNVKGCFQYSGYVVYLLQAHLKESDFTLVKEANVVGSKSSNTVADSAVIANAGDTIEYKIKYKNTSEDIQRDIQTHDYLPKGMIYEDNSLNVYKASHPDGVKQDETSQKAFIANSKSYLNVGGTKPGSEVKIVYRAKLPTEDKLECGENRFENAVIFGTKELRKIATSIVTVVKKCSKDNPKQPNNPNKPQQPQTGICKYNRNLKANDKKCVKPGAPRAGVKVATAAVSLVLFLGLASFITYRLVRANKQAKQSNK